MQQTIPITLLPGFKFRPTEAELVGYYLINKIKNIPVAHDGLFVKNCDLYGQEEPWDIWNRFEGRDDEDLFFFTHLKKKTPNGSRVDRRVGSPQGQGTWHGEDSGFQFQVRTQDMCIAACKKRFNYRNPESDQHGRWIMHEYSCSLSDNLVLCLLRKNDIAAHVHNNMTARVKKNSSRKRKLSEFQQVAALDQVESVMPTDSKQLKLDEEAETYENQHMGLVCINGNESATVAAAEEGDDIEHILDRITFDGCFDESFMDYAFNGEAASVPVWSQAAQV